VRLLLFAGLLGAVAIFLPRGVLPVVQSWVRWLITRGEGRTPMTEAPVAAGTISGVGNGLADRAEPSEVLVVRGVSKSFGGLRAVDCVDLDVVGARITGLIGPNGSGKTTLFNLIDGTVPTRDGTITLGDRRLDRRGRPARAHAGLARTYQLPRLFAALTVVENIVVPERRFAFGRLWTKRVTSAERERAIAVIGDLGLADYADRSPADLSYGQRKLVELAQVLWLDPVLVMVDEPAAGISPALSERLAEMISSLRRRGVAVLLIEHDLAFIASLCERVYVMSRGAIIAQGSVADISAERAVVDAYLGDTVAGAPAEGKA
jgi:branched-chain amino acid transport system permease protein